MKIFILKGAPINRLLENELLTLRDNGIGFAMTQNNMKFGFDNKEEGPWSFNTNTLIFMWPELSWVDGKDPGGVVVGDIIKNIFSYREDINLMGEWTCVVGHLTHMNANSTLIYNLNTCIFGD